MTIESIMINCVACLSILTERTSILNWKIQMSMAIIVSIFKPFFPTLFLWRLAFQRLSQYKIWEPQYIVYTLFQFWNFNSILWACGGVTDHFTIVFFIIYSSHFDIFSNNCDLPFLPVEKSLIVQIDRPWKILTYLQCHNTNPHIKGA